MNTHDGIVRFPLRSKNQSFAAKSKSPSTTIPVSGRPIAPVHAATRVMK